MLIIDVTRILDPAHMHSSLVAVMAADKTHYACCLIQTTYTKSAVKLPAGCAFIDLIHVNVFAIGSAG